MWHFLLPQKACWPSLPAPISYLKQTTASVASAHSIPYMFSNILPAVTPTQSTCPRYTMYFISISRENKTGERWMSSASHHRHLKPESEMPAILLGKETFEPLTNPKPAFLLKWMKGWQAKPTNHFLLGNTCFPHIFVTQRKEKICHRGWYRSHSSEAKVTTLQSLTIDVCTIWVELMMLTPLSD